MTVYKKINNSDILQNNVKEKIANCVGFLKFKVLCKDNNQL